MKQQSKLKISRRRLIQTTVATGIAAMIPANFFAQDAKAATDLSPRFIKLIPGGNGIIYAIQANGDLYWYQYLGSSGWVSGSGLKIGTQWHQFQTILATADGQIFGILPNGDMYWYKLTIQNGSYSWGNGGTGSKIGGGFNIYPRLFGGWDGEIYGVKDTGELWWYKYTAQNGTSGWANGGNGLNIRIGWKPFKRVWADPNGVIYGVQQGGELYWWRYHQGPNYSLGYWDNGGTAVPIGPGWGEDAQRIAFSNQSGNIYTVKLDDPGQVSGLDYCMDDKLYYYQLLNSENITPNSVSWANGNGIPIGQGWTIEPSGALQGYTSNLSAQPGNTVSFYISTTYGSYTASIVNLVSNSSPVWGPYTVSGTIPQTLSTGYRSNGCNWAPNIGITIPSTWQPGIYSMNLAGPWGHQYHIVFGIRPSTPSAKIAFLLPTNTYNAYNYWGGHSRYTVQSGTNQTNLSFLRPSTATEVDPPATISHTLYSDLFLLRWMYSNGIAVDYYHDGDLNTSSSWLSNYKALILASHPEYWTDTMRSSLVSYLNAGGRLICTGGNGIYERTSFSPNIPNCLTFTNPRDQFVNYGEDESQIIGANLNGGTPPYMTFANYTTLQASHPFFANTGLVNGQTFGNNTYDGSGASGWEVNSFGTSPNGTIVLASGNNPGSGAKMVYVPFANNGWAFSANSISFNGALPSDTSIVTLLKNILYWAQQPSGVTPH